LSLRHDRDCVFAGAGFADDVEAPADVHSVDVADDRCGRREKLPQAGSEKTLVVCENDADCGTYR